MIRPGTEVLLPFQEMVRQTNEWPHWEQVSALAVTEMSDAVKAGFAAPCPDPSYIVGNRAFALMLPTRNDNPMLEDNWRALERLNSFDKPFLCVYSDKDIVAPTGYKSVQPIIPGARAYEPIILEGGSHFLLEDIPDAYCDTVLAHLSTLKS
jgi:haloalkane dehalogenase